MRVGEFLLTSMLIELTPGPNMAYLAALALGRGRIAGMAAVAGVALGLSLIGTLAALGIAELITRSPVAYQMLRWAGVLYLFWLAWEGWRDSDRSEASDGFDEKALAGLFGRGFLTNILNPKAAVFYIAILPSFIERDGHSLLVQNIVLVGIYVLVATTIHLAIVLFAARVGGWLASNAAQRRVRRGLAVGLALVALWFAWETRAYL